MISTMMMMQPAAAPAPNANDVGDSEKADSSWLGGGDTPAALLVARPTDMMDVDSPALAKTEAWSCTVCWLTVLCSALASSMVPTLSSTWMVTEPAVTVTATCSRDRANRIAYDTSMSSIFDGPKSETAPDATTLNWTMALNEDCVGGGGERALGRD